MVRPGLVAGAALVFLTAMKELPTTILLAPTGFDTLAVRIWSATSEGFFARAAAPALLMILVAAGSLGLVLRLEHDR
jgi:iron(III) transport system permease protein